MVEKPLKDLSQRTKEFALRIIRVYSSLPTTTLAQVLGKQLLRSGTSVGAHYREASRARSDAEFISKLGGGHQELEESIYWMELMVESNLIRHELLTDLMKEANELSDIFTTCKKKHSKENEFEISHKAQFCKKSHHE